MLELKLLDVTSRGDTVWALGPAKAATTTADLVARDFEHLLIALIKVQIYVARCICS